MPETKLHPISPTITPESQIMFTHFALRPVVFLVTGHFETGKSNDRKIALNTKRWNVSHIYNVTIITGSQISPVSLSAASHFQVKTIWDKSTEWPSKWHWRIKGQRCPVYMLQLPPSPKFHPVSLYSQLFSSYRSFWDKCTKWPQNDLEHKGQKYPLFVAQVPESQVSLRFALQLTISKIHNLYWQFFMFPLTTLINFNLLFF